MFEFANIIYFYLIVVILIVFFNIFYSLRETIDEKTLNIKHNKYKELIKKDLKSKKISKDNYKFFRVKLRKTSNLNAFDMAISDLSSNKNMQKYLEEFDSIFYRLVPYYSKKDKSEQAFFVFMMKNYYVNRQIKNNLLIDYIMKCVSSNSIYLRENAMLFLYNNADEELVYDGLKIINDKNIYYSKILLTDDLLTFKGDNMKLKRLLLSKFDYFNSKMQVSIVNYFKYKACDECMDVLYKKLISNKYDKEVNLAIIRFFGKYKYDKVIPYLEEIIKNKDIKNYEYRLVSAYALGNYSGNKIINLLIEAIEDENYYVRKNAAISLSNMNLSKTIINKIKSDKYASEMLDYVLKEKSL